MLFTDINTSDPKRILNNLLKKKFIMLLTVMSKIKLSLNKSLNRERAIKIVQYGDQIDCM